MPQKTKDTTLNDGYLGPIAIPHPRGTLTGPQQSMLQQKHGVSAEVRSRKNWGGRKLTVHGEPDNLKACANEALDLIAKNAESGIFAGSQCIHLRNYICFVYSCNSKTTHVYLCGTCAATCIRCVRLGI